MCSVGTGLDIKAQARGFREKTRGRRDALDPFPGGQKGTMPGIFWVLALPPKRLQLFAIETKHEAYGLGDGSAP